MNETSRGGSRRIVLLAGASIVALAAILGARLLPETSRSNAARNEATGPAPRASVPAPKPIELARLEVPCWGCRDAESWPVDFRTDLDLLAPLGDGPGNAAAFFSQFAEPDGRRNRDYENASARAVDAPSGSGKILAPDDPFLLEAEPWCDQATLRFYPDYFTLEGWDTRVPNLLMPLLLARSWTARGHAAADAETGLADFRRTIRLGRLLRQDGTTLIADLVGLAVIRIGTTGIYERARSSGDAQLALAASIVLGEIAPQRLLESERITRVDVGPYLRRASSGAVTLELPETRFDPIVEMAKGSRERRFRGEAILALNFVRFLGSEQQRERAGVELEQIVREGDSYAAGLARWSLDHEPKAELLASLMETSRGSR